MRFAPAKVQVGVSVGAGGRAQIGTGNQAVAAMVRQLEERGIPRDKITPEMIENLLDPDGAQKAIEGAVSGNDSDHRVIDQ
jgi:undecaprenyl pyrophosphate synthase